MVRGSSLASICARIGAVVPLTNSQWSRDNEGEEKEGRRRYEEAEGKKNRREKETEKEEDVVTHWPPAAHLQQRAPGCFRQVVALCNLCASGLCCIYLYTLPRPDNLPLTGARVDFGGFLGALCSRMTGGTWRKRSRLQQSLWGHLANGYH